MSAVPIDDEVVGGGGDATGGDRDGGNKGVGAGVGAGVGRDGGGVAVTGGGIMPITLHFLLSTVAEQSLAWSVYALRLSAQSHPIPSRYRTYSASQSSSHLQLAACGQRSLFQNQAKCSFGCFDPENIRFDNNIK